MKNKIRKKSLSIIALLSMAINLLTYHSPAYAADSPDVVINEIAWMGTQDNSNHEWIELYNNTDQDIDLSGWYIEDDDSSTYTIASGEIKAKSHFVIEDTEDAIASSTAGAVIGVSLANSGDKLVLKNATSEIIDTVNENGSAWYAGNNTEKTSMERIDSTASGNDSDNWDDNSNSNGSVDSNGNPIKGTPGSLNSVSVPSEDLSSVSLLPKVSTPKKGDTITFTATVTSAKNLFAYGASITYDEDVLQYQSSSKGSFLSENDTVSTSFQASLENNNPGILVLAEAKTQNEKSGTDGSGNLFQVNFLVTGELDSQTEIRFSNDSFLSDPNTDILSAFTGASVSVNSSEETTVQPVQNPQAQMGSIRYTIDLTWEDSLDGSDSFRILRKSTQGVFVEVGVSNEAKFTDDNDIVPAVEYEYQIIAVKQDGQSTPVSVSATEQRGLQGDFNRSDRIDGRDLQSIAKHFGEDSKDDSFNALLDLNFDGVINGLDLIEMTSNWALTYS